MYELQKDKIIIYDKSDFDAKDILECGQVFRFLRQQDGSYRILSLDKKAIIKTYEDKVVVYTDTPKYFENYLDLKTDYKNIKAELSKFDELKEPIKFGKGIRILKQDFFEAIISFIISANNNIKRIQSIIEKICISVGKNMGDYYAFPTLDQLLTLSVEDFKSFGAGYRAEYLYKTARLLKEIDLASWESLDTETLRDKLTTLYGVGPKVADCILLFGVGKKDVFPVDTWIAKVYRDTYGGKLKNRKQIAKYLVSRFGDFSGYAQQYLFYSKRELS